MLAGAAAVAVIYGGAGDVFSGTGALVATLAALGAAALGFLWLPLRRLYGAIRVDEEDAAESDTERKEGSGS